MGIETKHRSKGKRKKESTARELNVTILPVIQDIEQKMPCYCKEASVLIASIVAYFQKRRDSTLVCSLG